MLVVNALLIHKIMFKNGISTDTTADRQHRSKRLAASISVIILTFLFIVMTLPDAIATGFYLSELLDTNSGTAVLFAADCLAFSFHGFNSIILLVTNSQFRQEFKSTLRCCRKNV